MAENVRTVSIGEMVVSNNPDDVLVAYGLGSCVAICMYDRSTGVGGMLHALLPSAPDGPSGQGTPTKFVTQGVPQLLAGMTRMGANPSRLIVQVYGGAHMLAAPGFKNALNIGERNVQAAESALKAAGLQVRHQDTGGQAGRTVRLHVADGQVVVKTRGQEELIMIR